VLAIFALRHGTRRVRFVPVAALALALPFLTSAARAEENAQEVLARVQAWIDGTRDLECEFVQTLESGALGSGVRERGRLLVRRPGQLRWEYTDPEKKTALLLGNRTLLYLPEDHQLVRGRLSEDEGLLPSLLAGNRRLGEIFEATLAEGEAEAGRGSYRLRLVPIKRPEGFEEVTLTVRSPQFAIEEAGVLDGMGNRTRYEFRSVRRNRGLPESAFRFEPPPGTEIVDQ
jgi:outer membrane lipoprotein carrier protein